MNLLHFPEKIFSINNNKNIAKNFTYDSVIVS